MNVGGTVELSFFFGKRLWLTGVDYFSGGHDEASGIRFRLDGVVYEAIEDESDGYRSAMDEIRVVDTPMINAFQPVEVVAIDPGDSDRDCVSFCDTVTGKGVLEVGTDFSDDYYPCFVASYQPENMLSNQERHAMLKKVEASLPTMRRIRATLKH